MVHSSYSPEYSSFITTTYSEQFQRLCAIVFKMIPDYNVAQDIVQEVFIKIWKKKIDFDNISNPNYYLNKAVKNHCLNYLRRRREVSTHELETLHSANLISGIMENKELENQINQVIDSFPERRRQIFLMSRFEQKKYSEIAEELGISVKTVENHISKALKTLRERIIYN